MEIRVQAALLKSVVEVRIGRERDDKVKRQGGDALQKRFVGGQLLVQAFDFLLRLHFCRVVVEKKNAVAAVMVHDIVGVLAVELLADVHTERLAVELDQFGADEENSLFVFDVVEYFVPVHVFMIW